MSNPKAIVVFIAALILLVGAIHQICCAIYMLGCFRRFNRAVDTATKWFDEVGPDEAAETVGQLALVGFGIAILVAVVV